MSSYQIIFDDKKLSKFLKKLLPFTQAKTIRTINLLEKHGPFLTLPFAKKVDRKLWELRILGKQQVRFFYSFKGKRILILGWFVKKTNKISQVKINQANLRLQKYSKDDMN